MSSGWGALAAKAVDQWIDVGSAYFSNTSNRHAQRRAYEYASALQRQAQEWSEHMSNTAHQREKADLLAAGINPLFTATGGSGATAYAGMSGTPVNQNPSQGVQGDIGDALRLAMEQKANNALIEKTKAEKEKIEEEKKAIKDKNERENKGTKQGLITEIRNKIPNIKYKLDTNAEVVNAKAKSIKENLKENIKNKYPNIYNKIKYYKNRYDYYSNNGGYFNVKNRQNANQVKILDSKENVPFEIIKKLPRN